MAPETEAYQLETYIFHILKSIKRLRHGVRSKESRIENISLPFECCNPIFVVLYANLHCVVVIFTFES